MEITCSFLCILLYNSLLDTFQTLCFYALPIRLCHNLPIISFPWWLLLGFGMPAGFYLVHVLRCPEHTRQD